MKFKEFSNPEGAGYDIKSSLEEDDEKNTQSNYQTKRNPIQKAFSELLWDLGFPETYELEPYGITEEEYDNPTIDSLNKLKNYASDLEKQSQKHKH